MRPCLHRGRTARLSLARGFLTSFRMNATTRPFCQRFTLLPLTRTLLAIATISAGFTANADISGFGGDGTGWTLNYAKFDGRPAIADNRLRLNDASRYLANSAFHSTLQDVRAFQTSFWWTCTTTSDGYNPGDGFAFVVQRAGTGALGSDGNGFGYRGIGNSVALAFNIMGGDLGQGIALGTNGVISEYASTAPVSLRATHQLEVEVRYDGATLAVDVLDLATQQTFTSSYPIDLPAVIGGSTAYVGFTAGSGQAYGWQYFDDFSFTTVNTTGPELTIRASRVEVCWPSVAGKRYQLQSRTEAAQGDWQNVGEPVIGTGANLCVEDAIVGSERRIYRVVVIP